jgi:hypothetical protein
VMHAPIKSGGAATRADTLPQEEAEALYAPPLIQAGEIPCAVERVQAQEARIDAFASKHNLTPSMFAAGACNILILKPERDCIPVDACHSVLEQYLRLAPLPEDRCHLTAFNLKNAGIGARCIHSEERCHWFGYYNRHCCNYIRLPGSGLASVDFVPQAIVDQQLDRFKVMMICSHTLPQLLQGMGDLYGGRWAPIKKPPPPRSPLQLVHGDALVKVGGQQNDGLTLALGMAYRNVSLPAGSAPIPPRLFLDWLGSYSVPADLFGKVDNWISPPYLNAVKAALARTSLSGDEWTEARGLSQRFVVAPIHWEDAENVRSLQRFFNQAKP